MGFFRLGHSSGDFLPHAFWEPSRRASLIPSRPMSERKLGFPERRVMSEAWPPLYLRTRGSWKMPLNSGPSVFCFAAGLWGSSVCWVGCYARTTRLWGHTSAVSAGTTLTPAAHGAPFRANRRSKLYKPPKEVIMGEVCAKLAERMNPFAVVAHPNARIRCANPCLRGMGSGTVRDKIS